MPESVFQRSFAGGELSPSLAARADHVKYVTGLRTCRNFLVLRHGGVANRGGLRHIGTTKGSSTACFLLRYVSENADESVLLEAGPGYLRVYRGGALVRLADVEAWDAGPLYLVGDIIRAGGVNYYSRVAHTNHAPPNPTYWYAMPDDVLEIPSPFGSGFAWVQSGRVITMTSALVRPHELIYAALTRWAMQPIVTKPSIEPPTGLAVTPGPAGALSYSYMVTSAREGSYEESVGSTVVQVNTVGPPTDASPHVVSWTPPPGGAVEFYVYKDPYQNGTFGFIGTATGLNSFRDIGFTPDFAITPPLPRVLFEVEGEYPAVGAYYQQRRFFGRTANEPDAVFGSRVGFPSNFSISSPLQDDDAIDFKLAANQHHPIRHLLGLKTLIVLTDAGVWTVGESKTALSPSNLPADQETYVGVHALPPVVIANAIIYLQARGSIFRDLRFEQEVEGLAGRDLTLFAAHLFDGYTFERADYQATPHSVVWACRSDGRLLGMTYLRDQEVYGWHRHDTAADGRIEDVCVVPEGGTDALYVLVRRTIGDAFVRTIERLEPRGGFFVDAGLSLTSTKPVAAIAGLDHLEGEVVAVVADGVAIYNGDPAGARAKEFKVVGGTIAATLPPSTVIHAGLPITYELETLDLDVSGVQIRDKPKRVGSVTLLLDASARTFDAGPDAAHLTRVTLPPHETGAASLVFTGPVELAIQAGFAPGGRVLIRHTDPLPFTVLGIMPNLEVGG